ncbi:MAG: glycosyltransferase [Actinomycetota bacterium]
MAPVQQVQTAPLPTERFERVLDPERYRAFVEKVAFAKEMLHRRVVYNVNSTARGGGVAEMLQSLIPYARGAEVDARWMVIGGDPDFFTVTKRIHNLLHGASGDGGALGDQERTIYESALSVNADELKGIVTDKDVVMLHDPQTAGLTAALKEAGAVVIWRCHVGIDMPNRLARDAWHFLIPYVEGADAIVFSREAFEWEGLDESRLTVIHPSIDAFSPKNQDLEPGAVRSILGIAGLIAGGASDRAGYVRIDGSPATVTRTARYEDGGPPPSPDSPLIVQVSRWDRLKDPVGVINGFARVVAPASDAHLIVAGPAVAAVSDDPEGAQVLEESRRQWAELPKDIGARVHLATLPMEDGQENAAIVNALQRRADVIVQKSLAEGFGLTVAEGMWKGRPVVASRIGGIQDQISHGETGILIDDPTDLDSYGRSVLDLLRDPQRAELIGAAARERVRDVFLGPRHLMQYVDLIARLLKNRH